MIITDILIQVKIIIFPSSSISINCSNEITTKARSTMRGRSASTLSLTDQTSCLSCATARTVHWKRYDFRIMNMFHLFVIPLNPVVFVMVLYHLPFFFQALEVCQQRNFVEETVFLLSESWFRGIRFCSNGENSLQSINLFFVLFCLLQAGWETVDELCR